MGDTSMSIDVCEQTRMSKIEASKFAQFLCKVAKGIVKLSKGLFKVSIFSSQKAERIIRCAKLHGNPT